MPEPVCASLRIVCIHNLIFFTDACGDIEDPE